MSGGFGMTIGRGIRCVGGRWPVGVGAVCGVVVLCLAGCKDDGDATGKSAGGGVAAVPRGEVVDLAGLQKVVAGYEGKVLYLDFWATWCVPCVKGLPELAKLQKRYGPQGFQALPISFDEPEVWDKKVELVLKRVGWEDGPALIVKDKAAQKAIEGWLGKEWDGRLPAQYVIDPSGRVVEEILGASPEKKAKLDKLIGGLVEAKSGSGGA